MTMSNDAMRRGSDTIEEKQGSNQEGGIDSEEERQIDIDKVRKDESRRGTRREEMMKRVLTKQRCGFFTYIFPVLDMYIPQELLPP